MARGWESKSVEAQQEATELTRGGVSGGGQGRTGLPLSEQDAAKRTRRDTLMLARTRALSDLQRACVPAHRSMLEQAIADLDRQLALLAADNPTQS
jgi:hypothetical protein